MSRRHSRNRTGNTHQANPGPSSARCDDPPKGWQSKPDQQPVAVSELSPEEINLDEMLSALQGESELQLAERTGVFPRTSENSVQPSPEGKSDAGRAAQEAPACEAVPGEPTLEIPDAFASVTPADSECPAGSERHANQPSDIADSDRPAEARANPSLHDNETPEAQAVVEPPGSNAATTTADPSVIIDELLNQSRRQRIAFRKDLTDFYTHLRGEFRRSVSELKAADSEFSAAQTNAMQTLAETVSTTAASLCDHRPDGLEQMLSGIEERLLARIDSVAELIKTSAPSSAGQSAETTNATIVESPADTKAPKLPVKPGSGVRRWEDIRNEMLAAGVEFDSPSIEKQSPAAVVPAPPTRLPDVAQLTSDRHFKLPEQDPALEMPPLVDPEKLTLEELRASFCEREVFISTLLARIRRQQDSATRQLSPELLHELVHVLPDDLAAQVRHTLKQLNDLARVGELELSLERARIARQVNQLEHSRHTIERNARELGMQLNPDGSLSVPAGHHNRGSSSRRWLGKLGFGQ